MTSRSESLFTREIVTNAIRDSFVKLDPRTLVRNPVIFIVELGSIVVSAIFLIDAVRNDPGQEPLWFTGAIAFWLWITVLLANFAEAMAEGRGKAQAKALRATRTTTVAHRRLPRRRVSRGPRARAPPRRRGRRDRRRADPRRRRDHRGRRLRRRVGDHRRVGAGDPRGRRRPLGRHRRHASPLRQLVVEVTQEPGHSFLDRMIALVEGAERRKTPNEVALNILLAGLTITFLAAASPSTPTRSTPDTDISMPVLIALLVALIPTTIGGLLSAIGIAGMDRLVRRNVLAMSGRAVEAAGDVDVLLLDKTGTITLGNRQASEFVVADGIDERELADIAQLASLADETPEGRSIVVLAKEFGIRERTLAEVEAEFIPFTATTRMSGVDLDGQQIRKGAPDAIKAFVEENGGRVPGGSTAPSSASPRRAGRRSSSPGTTGRSAPST